MWSAARLPVYSLPLRRNTSGEEAIVASRCSIATVASSGGAGGAGSDATSGGSGSAGGRLGAGSSGGAGGGSGAGSGRRQAVAPTRDAASSNVRTVVDLMWTSARARPPALVIADQRVRDEHHAAGGGEHEAHHREARVPEQSKARLDAHQERGADDQRGQDQSGGHAVGDLLDALD